MKLCALTVVLAALIIPAAATAEDHPAAYPAVYYTNDATDWFYLHRCDWNNDDPTCPKTRAEAAVFVASAR